MSDRPPDEQPGQVTVTVRDGKRTELPVLANASPASVTIQQLDISAPNQITASRDKRRTTRTRCCATRSV